MSVGDVVKKRIAAVNIVILIALVFLNVNVQAYTYYDISALKSSDGFKSCVDSSDGMYFAGEVDGNLEMWYVSSGNAVSFSFFTDGLKNEAFSGCGSMVAAIFGGTDVRQNGVILSRLQILTYDFDTNTADMNTISATICGENGFALGKNCYYIIQNDLKTISSYSLSGKLQFSVYSERPVYQLIYDSASATLYVAYDGGMYLLKEKTLYDLGELATPISLAGKATISSSDGGVYSVSSAGLRYMCSVPTGSKAVVVRNRIYYSDGSVLYGQTSSGEVVCRFDAGFYIEDIFICSTKIAAVNAEGKLSVIDTGEMTVVQKETEPGTNNSNTSSIPNNQSSNVAQGTREISSSVYSIDNSRMTISGIKPGTTLAAFKSNMNYNGYKVSFRNYNGNSRTSGNVGTGFTATFSGEDERSYTLIVSGDLTGEGNINSLDVKQYMSFLCGKTELLSPFMAAFDINGDGINDTLDLLIAAKQ